MEKIKKFLNTAKRLGSSDSIDKKSTETTLLSRKTEYEIRSMEIKQLLEKQNYSKVVEILREQSHSYLHKCLESFPFKALNRAIPDSFLVWETLLTKLHNSEEGYIPQFPYAACDELVIQIAWLLETVMSSQSEDTDLIQSCRRVLKCVYMQYNEVLEHLYKAHEKVGHALYTLGLHLPLGSDFLTARTIQQVIKDEVEASLADYKDAIERLDDLTESEVLTLSQALGENQKPTESSDEETEENGGFLMMRTPSFPQAPNLNQVQLQERLYHNQCVITALQPSRRKDNLPQLLEILKERIRGDKEVLAIFGSIRLRNDAVSTSEAVEPWLKRHQHAIECAIAVLKEIEKELEITFPKAESPVPMVVLRRDSQAQVLPVDEEPLILPMDRPRSISLESGDPSPPSTFRRHSASLYDTYKVMLEEDSESSCGLDAKERNNPNRLSAHYYHYRPRSASPHKILRVNGGPPLRSGSSKSINSSNGSCTNLISGTSSSVHDLNSTRESQPLPAFTRVQSLKTNNSVQVVAGKRKKSSGGIFNSTSANNVNSKKKPKLKKMFRSGSGSLDGGRKMSTDTSMNGDGTHLELELKLNQATDTIQDMRKRERELTDRLSEQAQRHLQDSEKFEDILLGASRPTMVIQRYDELFSQGRMDALDAIEQIQDHLKTRDGGVFGIHLVLDVFKMAYHCSWSSLKQLHSKWRKVLDVGAGSEDRVAVKHLESAVGLYLKRVCCDHDIADVVKAVKNRLVERYESNEVYKAAAKTGAFQTYIQECAKVSWDLCVQTPPMVIDCSVKEFNPDMHKHFHTSKKESGEIVMYHWPTLLQTTSGPILSPGTVQT